jgi:hypothetical protein
LNVIDPGMGNPTDTPSPRVIGKLCEAARDERHHRNSVRHMCQEARLCGLPALCSPQFSPLFISWRLLPI